MRVLCDPILLEINEISKERQMRVFPLNWSVDIVPTLMYYFV